MINTLGGRPAVSAVVLAAGRSSRLDGPQPKQLLEFEGKSLIRWTLETVLAARLLEVILVLGHQADAVLAEVADIQDHVRPVHNPAHRDGQSSSVRCGLAAVSENASAALFVPVDQPRLRSESLERLVRAHTEGAAIVVPVASGRRGSPVLFARPFFAELNRLEGDVGGRAVLRHHSENITEVTLPEQELFDLDTLADVHHLRGWN